MASVKVHHHVGEIELFQSVGNPLSVPVSRVSACLVVDVGDQVGKRIRLDHKGNRGVGVVGDDIADCYVLVSAGVQWPYYRSP